MKLFIGLILLCSLHTYVQAWDTEELEIFDLVEEINKNFYEFMGLTQEATHNEVKRAFRNLSIVLHPDKNPSEDANIQFRNLVSIYEVLKDPSKREKYNKVLKDGLPNWKSALYYYRRMRKIGLYEGALIIFIVVTIGQYIFAWAAYLEKKYTAEQVFGSKLKKIQKKNKNIDMDTILNEIPVPSIFKTLPFQIPLAIWNLPKTVKNSFNKIKELKDIAIENRRLELEAAKQQEELEKELEEQQRIRKEKKENLRKRKQNTKAPEKTDDDLRGYSQIVTRVSSEDSAVKPVEHKNTAVSGGFWTDEDLTELIRLVKKYPSGAGNRWNTIAEAMNRTVQEVTFMAAKMKENGYRIPGQSDSVAENIVQQTNEAVKKEKIKKTAQNDILLPETNWSQEQQRALEAAIIKYRKNATGDRWEKIANCVPEKTKEECLVRYKYLCELVKSQKKAEEDENKKLAETANSEQPSTIDESSQVDNNNEPVSQARESENDEEETALTVGKGGKKRNKRKERRRRGQFSSDEESDIE
ncbi:uncharacterized protein F54F2.9 [Teleopsis dalmanni]|uniref:uncharacterized protein F54F2.9 n=1 Tax=Teleopsis dalmanni TaxID=139649 RepID=UPI0018CECFD2|nr:uncharacterized protein F54F2.9 [Teleopsis dalmanni]